MIRFYTCAVIFFPLGLQGCLTYGPQELSAMSTLDLCERQIAYRAHLPEASSRAVQGEVQRRDLDCGNQAEAIQARRADDLYDRMYRNQSP